MNKRDYIPDPVKYRFWEHVCFYNYLQHYLEDGNTPKYVGNEELFAKDWDAFQEILEELQPELIYVWNESIKETILAHEKKLTDRIEYLGETDMQGLTIYRFLYKHKPVEAPEILLENFSRKFQQELSALQQDTSDAGSTEKLLLDILQLLRFKTRASGAFAFLQPRTLMRMAVYLYPQVWNRPFSVYLIKRLQEEVLAIEGLKDLDNLYAFVSKVIDSKKWESVYSTFYWEQLEKQMQVQSLGMIPPFEWAWYSLMEPHRGFLFTRTPADCLIAYLDKSSDYLGSYLLDLMGYPLSAKGGMFIICHPDDIDSYLNILKNNRTGLKVREVREWEHLLMLVLEKGYEGKEEMFYLDRPIKNIQTVLPTLRPYNYGEIPKDERLTSSWFKALVERKDIAINVKSGKNNRALYKVLYDMYNKGLLVCYKGHWIGPGEIQLDGGKLKAMTGYQYAYLGSLFKQSFDLTGEQFKLLFNDSNIDKITGNKKFIEANKDAREVIKGLFEKSLNKHKPKERESRKGE